MIVINLKNYHKGDDVLRFIKKIKYHKDIIICPPLLNVKEVKEKTNFEIFSQAVDYETKDNSTGKVTLPMLKKINVKGTIVNHSENKIDFTYLKKISENSKKYNIKLIVCAEDLNEVKKIIKLKPWAIAFEDPKLIGSKKSITEYKSKDVEKFASIVKKNKIIPLCGAGINKYEDYENALKLGCKGILVASSIAKSKNPNLFFKR